MIRQRIKNIILLIIPILLLWSACKKYEEGPLISFRSTKKRLGEHYSATAILINNDIYEDIALWGNINFDQASAKVTLSSVWPTFYDTLRRNSEWLTGTFHLNRNLMTLSFDTLSCHSVISPVYFGPFSQTVSSEWTIRRLSMKDMVIECDYNQDHYRIYLDLWR
ncbi:MAG: hypothetical protein KKA07_06795 [Bacteroidetes bacterium]|nr:hypothetical protein [Bacteroidota bacterium]MBU1718765.1 hypothetical protein [Bacteroidota bacterium]